MSLPSTEVPGVWQVILMRAPSGYVLMIFSKLVPGPSLHWSPSLAVTGYDFGHVAARAVASKRTAKRASFMVRWLRNETELNECVGCVDE
jgi:hypothetical protein